MADTMAETQAAVAPAMTAPVAPMAAIPSCSFDGIPSPTPSAEDSALQSTLLTSIEALMNSYAITRRARHLRRDVVDEDARLMAKKTIAAKLMEGYSLKGSGECCFRCQMPLMLRKRDEEEEVEEGGEEQDDEGKEQDGEVEGGICVVCDEADASEEAFERRMVTFALSQAAQEEEADDDDDLDDEDDEMEEEVHDDDDSDGESESPVAHVTFSPSTALDDSFDESLDGTEADEEDIAHSASRSSSRSDHHLDASRSESTLSDAPVRTLVGGGAAIVEVARGGFVLMDAILPPDNDLKGKIEITLRRRCRQCCMDVSDYPYSLECPVCDVTQRMVDEMDKMTDVLSPAGNEGHFDFGGLFAKKEEEEECSMAGDGGDMEDALKHDVEDLFQRELGLEKQHQRQQDDHDDHEEGEAEESVASVESESDDSVDSEEVDDSDDDEDEEREEADDVELPSTNRIQAVVGEMGEGHRSAVACPSKETPVSAPVVGKAVPEKSTPRRNKDKVVKDLIATFWQRNEKEKRGHQREAPATKDMYSELRECHVSERTVTSLKDLLEAPKDLLDASRSSEEDLLAFEEVDEVTAVDPPTGGDPPSSFPMAEVTCGSASMDPPENGPGVGAEETRDDCMSVLTFHSNDQSMHEDRVREQLTRLEMQFSSFVDEEQQERIGTGDDVRDQLRRLDAQLSGMGGEEGHSHSSGKRRLDDRSVAGSSRAGTTHSWGGCLSSPSYGGLGTISEGSTYTPSRHINSKRASFLSPAAVASPLSPSAVERRRRYKEALMSRRNRSVVRNE